MLSYYIIGHGVLLAVIMLTHLSSPFSKKMTELVLIGVVWNPFFSPPSRTPIAKLMFLTVPITPMVALAWK